MDTASTVSGSSSLESSPGHSVSQGTTSGKGPDDLQLLAKLEEANRLLEEDRKSTRSLSPQPPKSRCNGSNGHSGQHYHPETHGHSRQGSLTSMISNTSVCSNVSGFEEADDLWTLWGKIVNDWETIIKKKPNQIRDLIRKGIPHHFRGIAWQLMCGAHDSQAKQQYADYIKMESPCEKTIRRDITRTYPEHDFFKEKNGLGQESLFNVMKAFSLHDREVGYCQGSGFIVGLLLMQMPEEEAFAVLVKIMQEYRLRELFKPSMAELGLCMFQLECMIQDQLPTLFTHFQTHSFCVSMFASSWFLTLFTTTLPLSVACRIFDIFLSEGLEMVFKVGFAVLQLSQNDLLMLDMEGMIKYLQKDLSSKVEVDPDSLFNTAYQVKYNSKKMKKLEKEYNALKTKEQEEQVELRRLRTENRLLRQRIDNLEKETATLADRLIQDQVKYAQQEEEIFSLRRDLATVRQHDENVMQRLDSVTHEYEEFKRSNSTTSSASAEDQTQQDGKVQELEKQLSDIQEKEAESHGTMRELRDKIRELENTNRQLQTEPTTEIQSLQEELIACKLREAEANLSMKELRQKVMDLDKYWQKHIEKMEKLSSEGAPSKKASKTQIQQLMEDMMTLRIREAHAIGELKEMKQKVMELETQNHICDRQIKRQGDENEKLKEKLEEAEAREKERMSSIKELERRDADLQGKRKEDVMMSRIKDAEYSQAVAEMRQRVAELEIENQELLTAGQLQEKGERQDLENRIADLQEEVLQLKMARRLQSLSSLALNHVAIDTESDYDTDDVEATILASQLKLTDSLMCEDGVLPATLPNSHKLRPTELDSSDGEALEGREEHAKRRIARKKRRNSSRKEPGGGDSIDLDKTPTQDTINMELFAVELENGSCVEKAQCDNNENHSKTELSLEQTDSLASSQSSPSTSASDSLKTSSATSSTESAVSK